MGLDTLGDVFEMPFKDPERRKEYLREYRKTHPDKRNRREYARNWRRRNKESYNAYQRAYCKKRGRRIKKLLMEFYGGKCACCEEERLEFLTINHKNGDGKRDRKMIGNKFYDYLYKLYRNGEKREDLEVLCWNCNCSFGLFGYCPHKERGNN